MILPIIQHPNEILTTRSKEVNLDFVMSKDTKKLVQDMIETMYHAKGVGLAAPQIGLGIRLCVITKQYTPDQKDLVLFNPTWEKTSRKKVADNEGCLSVPYTFGRVKRLKNIKVNAINESGKKISFEASDFFARIVQHEVDHLNGELFIFKAKNIQEEYEEETDERI
ncbi:MAG: peptide deformylase [Candidatus Magasanikbacteria bacterium CG_4_9_14_3_um_filter_32_9]|uniref:Peptide deformylase n=1 Tax=Candidatus Magasanikbacteria bacterium CG_4_9_14_3_um_filter_32_9 TaxID=1974644 RepID=A0A2M7Z703_9BACT|nr:MAG: peptide deformylase [Candidatus Magasanikbacteria bacterium CG_4_9_14_3_um_filter_32_9]